MTDTRMFFDVRPDDGLQISCSEPSAVRIKVMHKSGRFARLSVTAPPSAKVHLVTSASAAEEDWLSKGEPAVPSTSA
ncbi:MAG: hypothetical protein KA148_03245 [Ottowia sp.]|nr:hypothetical protein [Ottowia sp.]